MRIPVPAPEAGVGILVPYLQSRLASRVTWIRHGQLPSATGASEASCSRPRSPASRGTPRFKGSWAQCHQLLTAVTCGPSTRMTAKTGHQVLRRTSRAGLTGPCFNLLQLYPD